MKLLITILSFLMLTSCSPGDNFQDDARPIPPPTEQPESEPETEPETEADMPDPSKNNTLKITIGSNIFLVTLATSATVTAFKAMLPLTLSMSDFNDNEKVADLPISLTTTAINPGTIVAGDIKLYGSRSLVLFYETFSTSYSYTKIGRIDNTAGLKAALGKGTVTIKFEIDED